MTMFHKPIQRTFIRHAKHGVVRCEDRSYMVREENGAPFSGTAKLHINVARPSAHVAGDEFATLKIKEIVIDSE